MTAFDVLLLVCSLPVLLAAAYLAMMSLVSFAPIALSVSDAEWSSAIRFDVVVAAHDEEEAIGATVRSLLNVDYPPSLRRVLVVADNCSDATAERAREAGAIVVERDDPARFGKGFAIERALLEVERDDFSDAVVLVDAVTVVSPNLLRACARKISAGAEAVQVEYAVQNSAASWRTRLMTIAFAAFHLLRSVARQRLELSAGLRGNGMAFTRQVLRRIPFRMHSAVEDVEYGVTLGRNGVRVHFVDEAQVLGRVPHDGAGSTSQRRRWENGRASLARTNARALLVQAWRDRDPVALDLALDLLLPPLSSIAVAAFVGTAMAIVRVRAAHITPIAAMALEVWSLSALSVVFYVLRGWAMSGTGLRGLGSLAWAPVFIAWKFSVRMRDRLRRRPSNPSWEPGGRRRGGR